MLLIFLDEPYIFRYYVPMYVMNEYISRSLANYSEFYWSRTAEIKQLKHLVFIYYSQAELLTLTLVITITLTDSDLDCYYEYMCVFRNVIAYCILQRKCIFYG